jgi:hypothetical protein
MIRQSEIEKDHVWLCIAHLLQCLIHIGGGSEHPKARLRVDHCCDPLAQQPVVVDQHQRDRHRRRAEPLNLFLLEPCASLSVGSGQFDGDSMGRTNGSVTERGLKIDPRLLVGGACSLEITNANELADSAIGPFRVHHSALGFR